MVKRDPKDHDQDVSICHFFGCQRGERRLDLWRNRSVDLHLACHIRNHAEPYNHHGRLLKFI